MRNHDILKKLALIPPEEWENITAKCGTHIELKLYGKTKSGAHCEQRLGMDAKDFYFGNAMKAVYNGDWEWKYKEYTIVEQLIRVINSMISEQVRKYKVEIRNGQQTVLQENEVLQNSLANESEIDPEENELLFVKLNAALEEACKDNEKYKELIYLKQQDFSYKEISQYFNCSIGEVYQMMETISRRAKKILKSM